MARMDHLFTPWRYAYVTTADKATGCLFCDAQRAENDRSAWVLHRATHCFVILNAYPYTSGHVMIAPYAHLDELRKLPAEAAREMMEMAQRIESVLREVYQPDGLNLGMNIGKAAGAGVASHVHLHILPRWMADSSFMTAVGETRILPESLEITYERLQPFFGTQKEELKRQK
jgi:ATP adenylyltransferase